jgi:hypothetical protein
MDKQKLVAELKALTKAGIEWEGNKLVDCFVKPTVIERDGNIIVSGEDGLNWCDYYGEFSGGYPFIDPVLEKFAADHGMFWEWENPGCIALFNL